MKNLDKELRELNGQRIEHSLSLRKQKLNKFILKRRLGLSNDNSLKKEEIIIKEEYKTKQFKDITDLLNFSTIILNNEKSDINDIKFAICLLKATEIKNDQGEVNNSNIIRELSKVLNNYINDRIIVNEILGILITFSFYLSIDTNMNLITNEYLNIYSKLSNQYFNDLNIFNNLIILLGNLAYNNNTAQKIFYQTKLFEEIYHLAQNEKAPKDKRDVCLWFLACFSKGIQSNNYFVNNHQLFKSLIDIMLFNLANQEQTLNCLDSIGNLTEIQIICEYLVTKKELFNFIFKNINPDYFTLTNKILINITSFNENINLYLIERYKEIIPYCFKLLNCTSNIIKGQVIFLFGNLIENRPSKINAILENYGIFDKIYEYLDSPLPEIIDKDIYVFNIMLISLNNEGIFKLFQKNIHLKLINILKIDYKREIIDKAIDAIIEFLKKDSQDGIIKQSFIDNGLKEVFTKMELDRNDAEIYMKTEDILRHYF